MIVYIHVNPVVNFGNAQGALVKDELCQNLLRGQVINMSKYSKKILKKLVEKPAIALDPLVFRQAQDTPPRPNAEGGQASQGERENKYAISRAIKNLAEAGYVEFKNSDNQKFLKITGKGRRKLHILDLDNNTSLVPQTWDGFWRIIILDVPEDRKNERESLRYLLKKANFFCVKNTVWISPLPYENLFMNIKKDLGFTTELMIIVTDRLDPETSRAFLEAIKN